MSRIPTKEENPEGLHARYIVQKINGEDPPDAEYFTLRLDEGEPNLDHQRACRAAILAYAAEVEEYKPKLAEDLRERYGKVLQKKD